MIVRQKSNKRELVLRYTLGKIHHEEKVVPLSKGNVKLRVETNKTTYSFSYVEDGEFKELESVAAKFLSSETLMTFTVVYLGMFAAGNSLDSE